ncbi:TPA: hypothetical protein ACY4SM_002047 [Clostridium perfringens]
MKDIVNKFLKDRVELDEYIVINSNNTERIGVMENFSVDNKNIRIVTDKQIFNFKNVKIIETKFNSLMLMLPDKNTITLEVF